MISICSWGVWRTYRALKDEDEEARAGMLKYWAVYASFVMYDSYFDWIFRWIPGHNFVKIVWIALTFLTPEYLRLHEYIFGHLVVPLASVARAVSAHSLLYALYFLLNMILYPSHKKVFLKTPRPTKRIKDQAGEGLSDSDQSTSHQTPRRSLRLSKKKSSSVADETSRRRDTYDSVNNDDLPAYLDDDM